MLLARVATELRTDKSLLTHPFAGPFLEEDREVFTLADFRIEPLFHHARATEPSDPELSRELCQTHNQLSGRFNETGIEGRVFAVEVDAAEGSTGLRNRRRGPRRD